MNIQYISDNKGHTTAIQFQIPIEDWKILKTKYRELEEAENNTVDIPYWQIELGQIELQNIANGTTELIDWEVAKNNLKF